MGLPPRCGAVEEAKQPCSSISFAHRNFPCDHTCGLTGTNQTPTIARGSVHKGSTDDSRCVLAPAQTNAACSRVMFSASFRSSQTRLRGVCTNVKNRPNVTQGVTRRPASSTPTCAHLTIAPYSAIPHILRDHAGQWQSGEMTCIRGTGSRYLRGGTRANSCNQLGRLPRQRVPRRCKS